MNKKELQEQMNDVLRRIANHKSPEQRRKEQDNRNFDALIQRLQQRRLREIENAEIQGRNVNGVVDDTLFQVSDLDELL